MSTSKIASLAGFTAILVGTWLVSVLAAECVFRLLGDEPSTDLQGLYVPFADGNYKLGSFVDTDAFHFSGHLSVHTDGLGLRCDAARRYAVKPGDAIDVVLIGDSQGFGNEVNFEDSLAGSLARSLGERGYRVANASVGGHHLASQYELARWLVEEQGVKVSNFVVLLTPAMIAGGDGLNRVTVGHDGRLYGENGRSYDGLGFRISLWMKSHLVTYLRLRNAVRSSGLGLEPDYQSPIVFQFYDISKQPGPNTEAFLAEVKKFQTLAAKHDADIQIVYVPMTVEADFGAVRQAAAKIGMTLDPDVPWRTSSWVAERLHIPLYNLKPVLEEVGAEGHALNVKADFHYSPTLSQACASTLAMQLRLPLKERAAKQ